MFRYQCGWLILGICFFIQAWADELEVRDAWIREAPPVAQSHAAYMELVNRGDKPIEITSILAEDYAMTMLHKTVEKNGMATMVHLDTLVVPPQGSVKLEPGSLHIMLMKPKRKLKAGDVVKITFGFDREHHQEVSVTVKTSP